MTDLRCAVWFADPRVANQAAFVLLDSVERTRRERLCMPADRDRFTVAAALLRAAAGDRLGIAPTAVQVARRCSSCGAPHGKPHLPGTGLFVSVSHSHHLVAVAVTSSGPVGIDVEHVAPRDTAGLARVVLAPDECASDAAGFYRYWCRKEAVVKATGEGLRVPLVEVRVSAPETQPRLVGYRGERPACALADLDVGPRYAGALAVLADGNLHLVAHDGTPLLTAA